MYAVIKAGGKQQKVKPGDVIQIEAVKGQGGGDEITFSPILVVDDDGETHFGKDVARAVVKGKLVGEEKGEKVRIFKYKSKTGYSKRQGHRQTYTLVEISDVSLGRRTSPKKAATAEADGGAEAAEAEERPQPEQEVEGATGTEAEEQTPAGEPSQDDETPQTEEEEQGI